jgi:hypothetical protein
MKSKLRFVFDYGRDLFRENVNSSVGMKADVLLRASKERRVVTRVRQWGTGLRHIACVGEKLHIRKLKYVILYIYYVYVQLKTCAVN